MTGWLGKCWFVLGSLLAAAFVQQVSAQEPPVRVDETRTAEAGIRKLSSRRLTLYTDLPTGKAVDELPAAFDQAFPQWCRYFQIDPAKHDGWRMTGFLMKDQTTFRAAGLIPNGVPPFRNGFAWGHMLWLNEQPTDYYRRHLLLHEGTHGFMHTVLGGCGATWYKEGMAELLSTHRWKDGRVTLNHIPANREEAPGWGRVRIIKDDMAARQGKRFARVLQYAFDLRSDLQPYAWSWAAATLLERHPRYHQRFRQLQQHVNRSDFNERFLAAFADDLGPLREEWQLFVSELEYGYDVAAMAIDFTQGKPPADFPAMVTVEATRGWQNSGLELKAGQDYVLRAAGRYQVADRPQIWWCEPGGVTMRYYRGRPLGILLGAVRPHETPENGASALLRPTVIGLGTTLRPRHDGTLMLRINDSAAELGDNAGQLRVEIGRD